MKILGILLAVVAVSSASLLLFLVRPIDPFIQKTGLLYADRMEGTPVYFKGRLLHIISDRNAVPESIEVMDGDKRISRISAGLDLISAIATEQEIVVFGTRNRSQVEILRSKDMLNWSSPEVVINPTPDIGIFNTSVSEDRRGYIMAYETCEPSTVCFNVRFKRSRNLIDWEDVGSIFSSEKYAACPTIRFANGYYYLFYLGLRYEEEKLIFETLVTRSRDLSRWDSPRLVLSPEDGEGINNSDLDFVEYDGNVYIVYADGDQNGGPVNIHRAYVNGSADSFMRGLFQRPAL